MNEEEIIEKTKQFVKEKLKDESTGHDWFHVERVTDMAIRIGKEEGADLFIVQLTALLHDIDDWKLGHSGEPKQAKEWMKKQGIDEETVSHICDIIDGLSYKGAGVDTKMKTLEGKTVQDADRLDALGAIGIVRCFATGPKLGNVIYDPKIKVKKHTSFEEYRKAKTTSINHFYEKLLLLKDRMNTETGKRIAEGRHKFMEEFLEKFFKEWEGEE